MRALLHNLALPHNCSHDLHVSLHVSRVQPSFVGIACLQKALAAGNMADQLYKGPVLKRQSRDMVAGHM